MFDQTPFDVFQMHQLMTCHLWILPVQEYIRCVYKIESGTLDDLFTEVKNGLGLVQYKDAILSVKEIPLWR